MIIDSRTAELSPMMATLIRLTDASPLMPRRQYRPLDALDADGQIKSYTISFLELRCFISHARSGGIELACRHYV